MATIHFFGKTGCINNKKQKDLLRAAGHQVLDYDLCTFSFSEDTLRSFFEDRPVADWFNSTAPAITSGEVQPALLDEKKALEAMLGDRLLIRRPLIQAANERFCGFDIDRIRELVGLKAVWGREQEVDRLLGDDLVTCPKIGLDNCSAEVTLQ